MAGLPMASYSKKMAVGGGGQNSLIGLLTSLLTGDQKGHDEARQANESRYLDILDLLGASKGRVMGDINGMGDSLRADSNQDYTDMRHNLITDLADRGLSGSTARISTEARALKEKHGEDRRIEDLLRGNRAAADERFTNQATGVMERREDPYPKGSESSAQLVALLGNLIGGGGGGGSLGNLGGGGARSMKSATNAELAIPALLAGAAPAANPRAAADAQQRNQDELARRRAMGGLQAANHAPGFEGDDRVTQALAYLQSQGWAQQNPSPGTPQIGFAPTTSHVYETGGGGYAPSTHTYSGGGSDYGYGNNYTYRRAHERELRQAYQADAPNRAANIAQQHAAMAALGLGYLPTPYGGTQSRTTWNFPVQTPDFFGGG